MSNTLEAIKARVAAGKARASRHGLEELRDDGIDFSEACAGLASAEVVEDSPNFHRGPCVLCLQRDLAGRLIHVLWGLAANNPEFATLITAYRPDPALWLDDFKTRRVP